MNNYNIYAGGELNNGYDNFFDFEAASSNTPWAGIHNSLTRPMQAAHADEWSNVMPLTQSEIESILANRASNAQNAHHSHSLTSPELDTNFFGFEESRAHGACFANHGSEIPTSTNLSDFHMPGYANTPPNYLDGGTFEEPQLEEPGDVAGALSHSTPNPAYQLSVSHSMAVSPIPTQDSLWQPESLESVKELWSVGGKCTWPNCTSKAEFKTWASLRMHLTNVHINPLVCSAANCLHKTPFGRLSDLRRHEQSAHSTERRFVCDIPSCDARIKEFARKDHLTKHIRERHDHYFCPMTHCRRSTKNSFTKPEDVAYHIQTEHGTYECALKACAQAPSSKFSLGDLWRHLRNHHGMSDDGLAEHRMSQRLSYTVIEADSHGLTCGQCKICEKQHYVDKE